MNTTLGRGAVQQVVTDYPQTKAEVRRISERLDSLEATVEEALAVLRREVRKLIRKRQQPDLSELTRELNYIATLMQVDLDIRHGAERVKQFAEHRKRAWWDVGRMH